MSLLQFERDLMANIVTHFLFRYTGTGTVYTLSDTVYGVYTSVGQHLTYDAKKPMYTEIFRVYKAPYTWSDKPFYIPAHINQVPV